MSKHNNPNEPKQVFFNGYVCEVNVGIYPHSKDNKRFIELIDKDTHETVAVSTVNLDLEISSPNHVIIKNYSENAGMLEALIAAGVVGEPVTEIITGFVSFPVCPLLYKGDN